MRKTTFLKTFLVALGMLVGTSAWADDYSSIYTRPAVGNWTNDDKTDWSASSAVEVNATYGLGANANSTATYVTKTFTVGANNKVKYEVDWSFATATGRTNNWNWIQFGDFLRIAVNSSYNVSVSTDGGSSWNETTLGYYKNTTKTASISLIFDTATKTVESFTFDGTDRTSLVSGTFTGKTFNTVSTGFVRGGSVSWTLANYITTITVSQAAQAVSSADYTINYKLGENLVKTVSSSSTVGTTITADVAIDGTEEGYVGKHYLITAADAPSMTLVSEAASNVLNVSVRAPYTATLNVTKNIGGVAESPVVTNLTETDAKVCSWAYTYPMYVQKDGVYYIADETSSFGKSGTFADGDVINKTVYYTNPDYSVVYFGEPNETNGSNITYSNGSTGYITGGVVYASNSVIRLGTLPAGQYHLITNVTGNANRNVVVGECTDTSVFPTALVTITTTGAKDETFSVDGSTPISISGKDQGSGKFNQSADVDYILVKASTVSQTIAAAGWASLFTPYALDFSGVTGLTAYTATVSGTTVTLTKVENVPANTGVVLKGVADNYSIPVIASSSTAKGNLIGAATATAYDAFSGYDLYALKVNGESKAQFYKVTSGNIAAGKAFLKIAQGGAARELSIVFDDETTGIHSIDNGKMTIDNSVYDLSGRRVAKPTKGLYIVNGKKVAVK